MKLSPTGRETSRRSTTARSASSAPGRRRRALTRNLRADGQAAHAPALAVVVVDRVVLRAAVVPDGERARLPAHAAGELGPRLVRLEEVDERTAFLLAHVAK